MHKDACTHRHRHRFTLVRTHTLTCENNCVIYATVGMTDDAYVMEVVG